MERQSGHFTSVWFWLMGVIANPVCSAVVSTVTREKMWSMSPVTCVSRDQTSLEQWEPPLPHLLREDLHGVGCRNYFIKVLQVIMKHLFLVFLPGKSHGRRSLVGCSPWGREELDTTERLHFHFSLSCIGEGNGNFSRKFLPGESQGRGSLVGCRLWGHTESDTTEVT